LDFFKPIPSPSWGSPKGYFPRASPTSVR